MKVVLAKAGGTATDILTFTFTGADFEYLAGGLPFTGKGIVGEVPDNAVKAVVVGRCAGSYLEPKELNRDLKTLAQMCADYEDGAEVEIKAKGQHWYLTGDETKKINRAAALAVGVEIAVGPLVTPKALMNARGTVASIKGTKCEINFTAGDLDRIKRATGKNFRNPVKMPVVVMEVI